MIHMLTPTLFARLRPISSFSITM